MSCANDIPTITEPFTAGDLEPPIQITWNQAVTTETSTIEIDRPSPYASITRTGSLLDAAIGKFEYPWQAGDLVAGEGQLVKAQLTTAGGRTKSTEYFKIRVEESIS